MYCRIPVGTLVSQSQLQVEQFSTLPSRRMQESRAYPSAEKVTLPYKSGWVATSSFPIPWGRPFLVPPPRASGQTRPPR